MRAARPGRGGFRFSGGILRVAVFIDWMNVYKSAREAFGLEGEGGDRGHLAGELVLGFGDLAKGGVQGRVILGRLRLVALRRSALAAYAARPAPADPAWKFPAEISADVDTGADDRLAEQRPQRAPGHLLPTPPKCFFPIWAMPSEHVWQAG